MIDASSTSTSNQKETEERKWKDRATRPWDPPISDYELPRKIVVDVASLLSLKISVIYSSPFRRCLQTSAVAAKSLNLEEILVHPGLGEIMTRVRKSCDDSSNDNQRLSHDDYLLTEEECAEEIKSTSYDQVRMKIPFVSGDIPPWKETRQQSMTRLGKTLLELQEKHAKLELSVLIVTHGDALQAAAQSFLGQTTAVYDLDFCALMVFDADFELRMKYGLQMLEF